MTIYGYIKVYVKERALGIERIVEESITDTIKQRKNRWIGHIILRRDSLLKDDRRKNGGKNRGKKIIKRKEENNDVG